jgi:hypothetical protein
MRNYRAYCQLVLFSHVEEGGCAQAGLAAVPSLRVDDGGPGLWSAQDVDDGRREAGEGHHGAQD